MERPAYRTYGALHITSKIGSDSPYEWNVTYVQPGGYTIYTHILPTTFILKAGRGWGFDTFEALAALWFQLLSPALEYYRFRSNCRESIPDKDLLFPILCLYQSVLTLSCWAGHAPICVAENMVRRLVLCSFHIPD